MVRECKQLQSLLWFIDPIRRVCSCVPDGHRASENMHVTKLFILVLNQSRRSLKLEGLWTLNTVCMRLMTHICLITPRCLTRYST